MSSLLGSAWQYRGFVTSSVVNEYRSRYVRSRFGAFWVVLHPLAQVVVFATILANVLAARIAEVDNKYSFVVYLLAGTLCWSLFNEIVDRCLTVFVSNGSLLKKIRFPRICLPLIAIGNALVSNLALLTVMVVILPVLGFMPNIYWLWLPLLIGITLFLATGIGVILGVLNVFARDVGQVMSVVMQFWFWLTPIVYPVTIIPEGLRSLLWLNPIVPLVQGYQNVLLFARPPGTGLWGTALLAMLLGAAALLLFRRASAEMVDVL